MDLPNNEKIFQNSNNNKRLFYLDILRVIACLCVIMIHTSMSFVLKNFGSFDFWVGNIFDSLARIGVPLFVMISGSVFLDENYSFTVKKLIRHIKKIVIFFVFWSSFYSLYYNLFIPLVNHNNISFKTLLLQITSGHFHLWFCYMIVGLYLIVPLLRLWVKKENINQVRYFIVLTLIFSMFLPNAISFLSNFNHAFSEFSSIIANLNIRYVGGYTVYFILGWYLNNYEIKHKKLLVILGIIGISVSIFGTAIVSIKLNKGYQAYDNLSVHIAFQAIMVFSLVKNKYCFDIKEDNFLYKSISFISKHSLGIYAVHIFILKEFPVFFPLFNISNAIIFIPVMFVVTFALSLLISFLLSKIPLLNKIV